MAGILPYTVQVIRGKPTLLFLLSRERLGIESGNKDRGLWSDFGGGRHPNETTVDAAAREAYEESGGILGSEQALREAVDNSPLTLRASGGYYTFLVKIPYDKMLPTHFRNIHRAIETNFPWMVAEDNGFFEKDQLRWLSLDGLLANAVPIRPHYMSIVRQLEKKRNVEKLME